jgi:dihydroneopterin aldolase
VFAYRKFHPMVERRRSHPMFERFTHRARQAMVLAQEEARHFNHNYTGTEHLLLGLLRLDEGLASRVLTSRNVSVEAVREQVGSIVGYGEEEMGAQAPFTPRSKKVLELALREAMRLDHNYIGTEHILLGLVRESEGVANEVLSNLGVEGDEIRAQLARMLGDEAGQRFEDESREDGPPEVARNQMLFRGRVASLQISARVEDQPQTLLVDLDYVYAVRDSGEPSGPMEHDDLLDSVVGFLEGNELGSVEAGIQGVGELILLGFPAVREVTISATRERAPQGHTTSSITVTRTFRR